MVADAWWLVVVVGCNKGGRRANRADPPRTFRFAPLRPFFHLRMIFASELETQSVRLTIIVGEENRNDAEVKVKCDDAEFKVVIRVLLLMCVCE